MAMIDLLPSHLKIMVKSGLRDARHVARKLGTATKNNGDRIDRRLPPGSGHLIGKIADYSDATLVALETIALDILSGGRRSAEQSAGPQPLGRYFSDVAVKGSSDLARDVYIAIKHIMRVKGVSAFRVHEASLETIHDMTLAQMPGHVRANLSATGYASVETVSLAAACLAQGIARALVVQEPLQLRDDRRSVSQETAPYVAAVIALSCAAVSYHRDLSDDDDIYSAVCSAIDSKYASIRGELLPGVSPEHLAAIFAGLIPHVP